MFATTFFRRSAAAATAAALLIAGVGISTAPAALAIGTTETTTYEGHHLDARHMLIRFDESKYVNHFERMQIINDVTRSFGAEATYIDGVGTAAYEVKLDPPVPHYLVNGLKWGLESQPEIEFAMNKAWLRSAPVPAD